MSPYSLVNPSLGWDFSGWLDGCYFNGPMDINKKGHIFGVGKLNSVETPFTLTPKGLPPPKSY